VEWKDPALILFERGVKARPREVEVLEILASERDRRGVVHGHDLVRAEPEGVTRRGLLGPTTLTTELSGGAELAVRQVGTVVQLELALGSHEVHQLLEVGGAVAAHHRADGEAEVDDLVPRELAVVLVHGDVHGSREVPRGLDQLPEQHLGNVGHRIVLLIELDPGDEIPQGRDLLTGHGIHVSSRWMFSWIRKQPNLAHFPSPVNSPH